MGKMDKLSDIFNSAIKVPESTTARHDHLKTVFNKVVVAIKLIKWNPLYSLFWLTWIELSLIAIFCALAKFRSRVFSTGEKALYSYSPAAEKAARQGLGGFLGLSIVASIAILLVIATVSISIKQIDGFTVYVSKPLGCVYFNWKEHATLNKRETF